MDLQSHLRELEKLDDDSLLRSLKRHVGSSNRLNALVLAHLAEVDARGAYRQWACETLIAYCVYELRLCAAARRLGSLRGEPGRLGARAGARRRSDTRAERAGRVA